MRPPRLPWLARILFGHDLGLSWLSRVGCRHTQVQKWAVVVRLLWMLKVAAAKESVV